MKKHEKLIRAVAALVPLIAALFLRNPWLRLGLCAAAALCAGYDVLWEAVENILHGDVFDENFLMCIAAVGAFCIGEYPEAAAVMIFYQIGEYFQSRAVNRSRKSIGDLMRLRPEIAHVQRNGELTDVAPADLAVGEIIEIRPAERVPVDAVVLTGESRLDTAAITGESVPQRAGKDAEIYSGSVNGEGLLTARVLRIAKESAVGRMLELVESASDKKAKTESFITSFARWYTPTVVCLAAALAILPPLLFGGVFSTWLYRALVFLVVSCPCALVISVPLGFFGGIGGAARRGILVKGGTDLETLARVDTVLLDKTGTLTAGEFAVQEICPVGITAEELLDLAAHAELVSPHPMAAALRTAKGELDPSRVTDAEEIGGSGAKARVDGRTVLAGRRGWIEAETGTTVEDVGKSAVYVAADHVYCGSIVVSDRVKTDAKAAVAALRRAGVSRIAMLTGDRKETAEQVAAEVGITEVYAELLPAQKVECAEAVMDDSHTVLFAGDGVNDAPLLARCDVGAAMGALGSDAAIEAADVVLMNDDLTRLAEGISIARRTVRIVKQNVVFSLAVKFLVLLLAALGLAGMWPAVFADVGVAMLAIANSMRTLRG